MDATITTKRTMMPVTKVWNQAKRLNDSEKLELITLLASSVKPMDSNRNVQPYTKTELEARIKKSEQQFANGQYQDFDTALDELEREFAEEDRELEMAEAI